MFGLGDFFRTVGDGAGYLGEDFLDLGVGEVGIVERVLGFGILRQGEAHGDEGGDGGGDAGGEDPAGGLPDRGLNPGAYGALLMRNLCIDRIRKLNPSEELPDDLPGQVPPDEELIRKESLGSLLRAMDTLPDSQRKLMRLHVLQGRSYDEIAAETGLSPLNIRVQVSLARKKLKQYEVH